MGVLDFPCESCGKQLPYSELTHHVCNNNNNSVAKKITISDHSDSDGVEILEESRPSKKNVFSSLGLRQWSGQPSASRKNSKKKRLSLPSTFSASQTDRSNSIFSEDLGDGDGGKPKVSAKEGLKNLGLDMEWNSAKKRRVKAPPLEDSDKGNFQPTNQSTYYDKLDHLVDEQTIKLKKLKHDSRYPLSEILRPKELKDYVGHTDIVGPGGIITKYIHTGMIPSMIFWGETGIGKTTLVRLILTEIKNSEFAKFYQINELSAVSSNLGELKVIYEKFKKLKLLNPHLKMILFLDEIHRFSKLQQDFFLNLIESSEMIFFGCTTENPSYKINDAMLSRCQMFNLEKPTPKDLLVVINNGLIYINKVRISLYKQKPLVPTKAAKGYLSEVCDGDYRVILNSLEAISSHYTDYLSDIERQEAGEGVDNDDDADDDGNQVKRKKIPIELSQMKDFLKSIVVRSNTRIQQRDLFSALSKCIIGGDANAAIIYLAYLFQENADPLEIANFLQEILMNEFDESEKFKQSTLLEFGNTVYYVITKLGLPECDMALVQYTYMLCESMKSRKIDRTTENVQKFFNDNPTSLGLSIPMHIRNAPTDLMVELGYHKGYKYNPDFTDGKAKQYYLPKGIRKADFVEKKDYGDLVEKDSSQQLIESMYNDLLE
ncbi:hypothetical protein DASC09_035810 [Saccharomycopsis crataegensis]|uniref:AAA+ ATPase domain-containing protein n=1 Tax=Saccharomycopsis crataegensis TaxID=43959 RepID=A0AAV5QNV6_9ASCO|nr:hypothetical protein DASC09_035810 [Saccharomycopsis crataegensis]